MSDKTLVLIVEDDKAIRNLLSTALEIHGYHARFAETGREALAAIISYKPNIIILDLGLPDMDGTEIIKKVRSWSDVPIIIVSARGEEKDKISSLDFGADDYLTKPFSVDELLARLRAALRRAQKSQQTVDGETAAFINGGLKIDYVSGCVFVSDKEVHLTPIEYRLLCLLAKNVGKVLTHNFILKEIWGTATVADVTPNLRVFMAALRKKIEMSDQSTKFIQTHIGVGYRMLSADNFSDSAN